MHALDNLLQALLLSLSVLSRTLHISHDPTPSESHATSIAQNYHSGEIFVSPNPPLGYLMSYWIGTLGGDDALFYRRVFSVIFGSLAVVLVYKTLRVSRCRPAIAFSAAILVLCEPSLVAQSTLGTEDAFSLFSAVAAVLGQRICSTAHTTRKWVKGLLITGLGLGFAFSASHATYTTVVWVLLMSMGDSWRLLGGSVSTPKWVAKTTIQFATVFTVAATVYLSVFHLHLGSLPFDGPGSGELSPHFRSTLSHLDNAVQVHYGSTITIRHHQLRNYLHSHPHNYPHGSGEQQVTLFEGDETYNEWIIETTSKSREGELQKRLKPVKDGDNVRLFHKGTGKYLHVNDVRPPMTEHDYANEVSCNGSRDLLGDINYEFKVRILQKESHSASNLPMIKLRATESVFQLIHKGTKCIMFAHQNILPSWAFGQKEVMCLNEPTIPNTLWVVESNSHPLDEGEERVKFTKYSFWNKVVEYHRAMWRLKALVKSYNHASIPITWPFGIGYAVYSDVLTPSPLLYYSNILVHAFVGLSIVWVSLKQFVHLVVIMNPFKETRLREEKRVFYRFSWDYLVGWVVHYGILVTNMNGLPVGWYSMGLVMGVMVGALSIQSIQSNEFNRTK